MVYDLSMIYFLNLNIYLLFFIFLSLFYFIILILFLYIFICRYDRHSLSRKAVDRIFNQVPRKFRSGHKDKMGFEDFLCKMIF
jgi:hypothetical protein